MKLFRWYIRCDSISVSFNYLLTNSEKHIFVLIFFVSRKLLCINDVQCMTTEFICKSIYRWRNGTLSNVVDRKSCRWEISYSITHMRGNRFFYPLLSHSNSMQTKWLYVLYSYPVCVCICVVLLHLQKAIFIVAAVRWWRCFSFHLFCFTSPDRPVQVFSHHMKCETLIYKEQQQSTERTILPENLAKCWMLEDHDMRICISVMHTRYSLILHDNGIHIRMPHHRMESISIFYM